MYFFYSLTKAGNTTPYEAWVECRTDFKNKQYKTLERRLHVPYILCLRVWCLAGGGSSLVYGNVARVLQYKVFKKRKPRCTTSNPAAKPKSTSPARLDILSLLIFRANIPDILTVTRHTRKQRLISKKENDPFLSTRSNSSPAAI